VTFVPGVKRASAAGASRLGAGRLPPELGFTVKIALRLTELYVAVIVVVVVVVTVLLVAVALALVAPAGMVTLAGTVAPEVLLLDRLTTAPPEGAAAVKVTVTCEVPPPVTVVGLSAIDESEAGVPFFVTVRLADLEALPTSALIVITVSVVTVDVVTVKLAEVWPAGMLTIGGGFATRLLVDRVAVMPPAGAGLLSSTVPVELVPPGTLVGLRVTPCKIGGAFGSGVTVTKIDFVIPPAVAKTFPPVGITATGLVLMLKLIVLLPSAIVTLGGT